MGGGLALVLATQRPDAVAAVVPCYGIIPWPDAQPDYAAMSAAVLGHYAEKDEFFTPEAANALAEQLRAMGKSVEIIVYPGADHAFFNDTRPEVYDAEARPALWERTLGVLLAHDLAVRDPPCAPERAAAGPVCYHRVMSARSRDLPRRSCLSTPGSNEKFLAKAPTVPADMSFLDLEDSVAPLEKEAARAKVVDAIKNQPGTTGCCASASTPGTPSGPTATSSRWSGNAGERLDEVMLPKVQSAAEVSRSTCC